MKSFRKLDLTFDIQSLQDTLVANPEYFNDHKFRVEDPTSPHRESSDIWVRFNDIEPYSSGERPFSEFCDEHISTWYPIVEQLPEAKAIAERIMSSNKVKGTQLGGVLITKIPPGKKIYPHRDSGWHAEFYDKFYIAIQNKEGAEFVFEGGVIRPDEGDVYQFNNQVWHHVINDSDSDRLSMVVCIRTEQTLLKS